MCQVARRNSPSVADCRPIPSCIATAAEIASSSMALSWAESMRPAGEIVARREHLRRAEQTADMVGTERRCATHSGHRGAARPRASMPGGPNRPGPPRVVAPGAHTGRAARVGWAHRKRDRSRAGRDGRIVSVGSLVSSGPLILAVPVAAAAGAVTFLSPCCLPLVPAISPYVTGMSGAGAQSGTSQADAQPAGARLASAQAVGVQPGGARPAVAAPVGADAPSGGRAGARRPAAGWWPAPRCSCWGSRRSTPRTGWRSAGSAPR